jgi:hypothetical protein
MKITEAQLGQFAVGQRAAFERRLAASIAATLGEGDAREGVDGVVRGGVARAIERGFRSCRAIASFVALRVLLGEGFEANAELPWARDILTDSALGPLDARIIPVLDEAFVTISEAPVGRALDIERWRRLARWAASEPLAIMDAPIVSGCALLSLRAAVRDANTLGADEVVPALGTDDAPGNHWVIPIGQGDIVVEAETRPNDESAWRQLVWSGGEKTAGGSHRRSISRARPGRHRLSVTLDGRTAAIEIWTIVARPTLRLHGTEGGVALGADLERGRALALFEASIEPPSVGRFVRHGFRVATMAHVEGERDGAPLPADGLADRRGGSWRELARTQVVPNARGEVRSVVTFELPPGTRCSSVASYRHWLAFQDAPCSESVAWHASGVRVGARVTELEVGDGVPR